MKSMTRREALWTVSSAASALLLTGHTAKAAEPATRRTRMGVVTYAFGIHQKNQWVGQQPALALLEEAHKLGAEGIQTDIRAQDGTQAAELRRRSESYGMYIEASIMPPKSADDLERFEADVGAAQAAGATLARTVVMPGRRYETFKSLEEFRQAEEQGLKSLQLAEPVLVKRKFRLAVENHKDQRIPEKLTMIKKLSSEYIGLCVDVGNSFTLLEDSLEVVRAYAPYAFTVHFKDQAVREAPDGFWFADVPLGEGFLNLAGIIKVLREAKSDIHLNLELITRDALSVPVLKNEFWVTMPDARASDLARILRLVKNSGSQKPFVNVTGLAIAQQIALESQNVAQSFAYAREKLGQV